MGNFLAVPPPPPPPTPPPPSPQVGVVPRSQPITIPGPPRGSHERAWRMSHERAWEIPPLKK